MSQQPPTPPSQPLQVPSQPLQSPSQPLPVPSHPLPSPPARPSGGRGWLRSRTGRVIVPVVALLLGIALGIIAILLYGASGEGSIAVAPATGTGDITIEADRAFLTDLVTAELQNSGLPGTIEHVDVVLVAGDQMTISGDDVFNMLGINVTKHFHLVVQLYITSCVLQIHVVHAGLSGIPVTGFAQIFESRINQRLAQNPSGLPKGFKYCATAVRTEPDALFVTYSAVPLSLDSEEALDRNI
jgi:hypothetical protein